MLSMMDFNPRPPCGGRRHVITKCRADKKFQSTAPVWGPTFLATNVYLYKRISIHGPRVGADVDGDRCADHSIISIHGPRVGADACGGGCKDQLVDFNPRPPCGGRLRPHVRRSPSGRFQSTAPVWGPTGKFVQIKPGPEDFNPRPPCGGRLCHHPDADRHGKISIHGPRVGADPVSAGWAWSRVLFQSTAPVWGPTPQRRASGRPALFQSTAPVWGPTRRHAQTLRLRLHFNPRPPCGGRPPSTTARQCPAVFQSTAPVWGPTPGRRHSLSAG